MSSKTLIVQVSQGRALGAVALASIGSLRVAEVFDNATDPAAPDAWLPAAGPWDRVVAGVPAQAIAYRILDLPFQDRRRIGHAVGPALEEHVPFSLDEATLAWDHAGPGRAGRVLAGLAPSAGIEALLGDLACAAAPATRLIWTPTAIAAAYRRALGDGAGFVAVDVGAEGAVIANVGGGGVEGLRIVAPCDDDLLVRNAVWSLRTLDCADRPLVLGGAAAARVRSALARALPDRRIEALPARCPVEGLEDDGWREHTALVGLLLVAAGEAPAPLLDFTPAGTGLLGLSGFAGLAALPAWSELGGEFRAALRWCAVALLLGGVWLGLDYTQLLSQRSALSRRADELYAAAMPDRSGGSGRRLKMEMRLRELTGRAEAARGGGAGGTSLHVLAALSQAVPKNLDVQIDQLEHSPPSVKMSGHADSFESVTRLQEALRRDGGFSSVEVKDVHTAVSGSGVEFVLALATAGQTG